MDLWEPTAVMTRSLLKLLQILNSACKQHRYNSENSLKNCWLSFHPQKKNWDEGTTQQQPSAALPSSLWTWTKSFLKVLCSKTGEATTIAPSNANGVATPLPFKDAHLQRCISSLCEDVSGDKKHCYFPKKLSQEADNSITVTWRDMKIVLKSSLRWGLVHPSRKSLMFVPIIPPRASSIWKMNCKILKQRAVGAVYTYPAHLKWILSILQVRSYCYACYALVVQMTVSISVHLT